MASTEKSFKKDLSIEYNHRIKLGFRSNLYSKIELQKRINSSRYYGALEYLDTFGINGYLYCQNLKKALEKNLNIDIFEDTPALKVKDNIVLTQYAKIKAKYIIFCVDKYLPKFNILKDKIYQTQAFLTLSNPLSNSQVKEIFPDKPYMCWDTELVYNYFRLVDNNRLLIGGSSIWDIYSDTLDYNNIRMFKKLTNYIDSTFKTNIKFDYFWSGLLGITKDIVPIAGQDKDNPNIYYISGATGLPWAAGLGEYSAKKLIDNIDAYDQIFDPYRKFKISGCIQTILGKKLTFALSNYLTLNQVV